MSRKVRTKRHLTLLALSCVSIAFVLASATNAQRSVLDEMAPLLKIEKTTMASVMKKERHVSKQLKRTVYNNDNSFSAFTVEIFYGDAGDGCDCVFFKNNHIGQCLPDLGNSWEHRRSRRKAGVERQPDSDLRGRT